MTELRESGEVACGGGARSDGDAAAHDESTRLLISKGKLVRLMTRMHFGPRPGERGLKVKCDVFSGQEFGEYVLDYRSAAGRPQAGAPAASTARGVLNGCWTWTRRRAPALGGSDSAIDPSDVARDKTRPLERGKIETVLFRAQSKEWVVAKAEYVRAVSYSDEKGECSFMYRYILRESCSQFDSLPLTYSTISGGLSRNDLRPLHTLPRLARAALGARLRCVRHR